MKEEFKNSAWKDFQQRYSGTFGWFEKASGGSVLVQLTDIEETRCKFTDKNGGSFTATADKGNNFTFLPVQRGVYNTIDSVISCKRIPAKQYRRGLCSSNTSLWDFTRRIQREVSFDLVEDMFGDKPNTRLRDFKRVYQGNLAFNRLFALVNDCLYLYDHAIGTYNSSKREFTLNDRLFEQELKDLINEHQFDLAVRIK